MAKSVKTNRPSTSVETTSRTKKQAAAVKALRDSKRAKAAAEKEAKKPKKKAVKVAPPHLSEKQKGKRRRVDTSPRDLFDGSDGREESPVASENDDVDDELPVLSGKQKGKRTKVNPVLDPDVAANDEAVRVKRRRSSLNGEQAAMKLPVSSSSNSLIRPHTRYVANAVIEKNWKKLSRNAQDGLRAILDDAALELLSTLGPKAKEKVSGVLREALSEVDNYLANVVVPPSTSIARPPKGVPGEFDLFNSDELLQKTLELEMALSPEMTQVHSLKMALRAEKKLLALDEERLDTFEKARMKVERAERKESSKEMHPLLLDLVVPQAQASTPRISPAWIVESMPPRPSKRPRTSPSDSRQAAPEIYDSSQDPFIQTFESRLSTTLSALSAHHSDSLTRISQLVGSGKRIIGSWL